MALQMPSTRMSRGLVTRIPARTKIKVLLAEHELTQTELALILGVNRQHLNAVITGNKRVGPQNKITQAIADYFKRPVDELFPLVDLGAIAANSVPPSLAANVSKSTDKKQLQNINYDP